MAITRIHGKVVFLCDECDDEFNTEEHDFDIALVIMKENGFISLLDEDDGEWKHFCSDCAP